VLLAEPQTFLNLDFARLRENRVLYRVVGRVFTCGGHYCTLRHTTTHCNTLQHPAAYGNILQHPAWGVGSFVRVCVCLCVCVYACVGSPRKAERQKRRNAETQKSRTADLPKSHANRSSLPFAATPHVCNHTHTHFAKSRKQLIDRLACLFGKYVPLLHCAAVCCNELQYVAVTCMCCS